MRKITVNRHYNKMWVMRQNGDIRYISRPRVIAIFDLWIRQEGEPIVNHQNSRK